MLSNQNVTFMQYNIVKDDFDDYEMIMAKAIHEFYESKAKR